MNEEQLLKLFYNREECSSCYEVSIEGIPVYNFIRRDVRIKYLIDNGITYLETRNCEPFYNRIIAIIKSFFSLCIVRNKTTTVLFHSFRIEKYGNVWLDRFIDPIIEKGVCGSDFCIIETNNGRRLTPRLHNKNILFDDFVAFVANISSSILYWYYVKCKYKDEIMSIDDALLSMLPQLDNKEVRVFNKKIFSNLIRLFFSKRFLEKKRIKCVVSASKSSFLPLLCAAKLLKIKVVELQHGLIYGESVTYGGYIEPLFTPDFFMTFGDVKPRNVYGIDERNVVTSGWALKDYIENMEIETIVTKDDILVLSQPLSTDYIIKSTVTLAKYNPDRRFFYRCHPLEKLNDNQIMILKGQNNIIIQEQKDAFLIALKPFHYVIGDDLTTSIYEASSYGKRVGVFALDGHNVAFLNEDASRSFWVINDEKAFESFLNDKKEDKPPYGLYSTFNKELFKTIVFGNNV